MSITRFCLTKCIVSRVIATCLAGKTRSNETSSEMLRWPHKMSSWFVVRFFIALFIHPLWMIWPFCIESAIKHRPANSNQQYYYTEYHECQNSSTRSNSVHLLLQASHTGPAYQHYWWVVYPSVIRISTGGHQGSILLMRWKVCVCSVQFSRRVNSARRNSVFSR